MEATKKDRIDEVIKDFWQEERGDHPCGMDIELRELIEKYMPNPSLPDEGVECEHCRDFDACGKHKYCVWCGKVQDAEHLSPKESKEEVKVKNLGNGSFYITKGDYTVMVDSENVDKVIEVLSESKE